VRTNRERHACPIGKIVSSSTGSMIGRQDGGDSNVRLPWDATKQGPVLKAKGPSPARHSAESSCRLRPVSGGEGPLRGVGSRELVNIVRHRERPELASAAWERSYVQNKGFHLRADSLQDTALEVREQSGIRAIQHGGPRSEPPFCERPASQKNFAHKGVGA
jgi:hypothetical protein